MFNIFTHLRRLNGETGGQVLVLFLIIAAVLIMLIGSVYNVGILIGEKMHLQNMADASAYSQAVWEARSYNYYAYTNRAMVAHFCTISFSMAIDSCEQLWKSFSYAIGWLPYVGQVIIQMHKFYQMADKILNPQFPDMIKNFYNPLYQTTQRTLFLSMWTSIMFSDIPDDIVRTTEKLAGDDNTVIINKLDVPRYTAIGTTSWGWPRWGQVDLVPFTNAQVYSEIINYDKRKLNFNSNFDMLKKVIESSQDYFATGSPYFPRHLMLYLPPKWAWPGGRPLPGYVQMGLQGHYQIKGTSQRTWWSWWGGGWGRRNSGMGGFQQEDSLRFLVYRWKRWKLRWRGPIYVKRAFYPYDLTNFRFPHMNPKNKITGETTKRSVYTILKQPKSALQTKLFPVMLGMREPEDIYAISRAEVYYKNPENPNQGATLFNAYWHARLAPVYDANFKYSRYEAPLFHQLKIRNLVATPWWQPGGNMHLYH